MSQPDPERHESYGSLGVVLAWSVAIGGVLLLLYAIKRRFYL